SLGLCAPRGVRRGSRRGRRRRRRGARSRAPCAMLSAAMARETIFTLEATPVKFGPGAADDAGWELRGLGVPRALLVTDPGVAATRHPDRVRERIAAEG